MEVVDFRVEEKLITHLYKLLRALCVADNAL